MKSIKDLLSIEPLKTLALALVLSRIDYGNIILARLPKYQKNRLQSLINTAARLITGTRKYDHLSPVLRDLSWLKIDVRIDYKLFLLMFKCLHNEGPVYLSKNFEVLSSIPGKQKLRSNNSLKVVPGESRLKTLGRKMFYVTGPTLYNNLPEKLRFSVSKHFWKEPQINSFSRSYGV